MRARPSPSRYGARFCDDCDGFAYVQPEPGVWKVCHACCGSAVAHVQGDREPGKVARFTRGEPVLTGNERNGEGKRAKGQDKGMRGFR